jgi:hypothetical protein
MTFTEVVFEMTGDISARRAVTCPARPGAAAGGPLARRYGLRLAERLGPGWAGPVHFRWPVRGLRGGELEWQQADPFSALASFRVCGLRAGQCMLLSGRDPASDANAVAIMQFVLIALLAGTAHEPGFALFALTERPAVVRVSCPRRLRPAGRRVLAAVIRSLAASFFAWVAALGEGE